MFTALRQDKPSCNYDCRYSIVIPYRLTSYFHKSFENTSKIYPYLIHELYLSLANSTFRGPSIVSIFQYISNKMQRYTVYLYLENALYISASISTHHQQHTQLYLQHLVLVKPLLVPAAIAAGTSNDLTSTRCCRYSCECS